MAGFRKIGFNLDFIEVLQGLYSNANSEVLVNGFLSKSFKIEKSVRQGCPLSMTLFAYALELCLNMIEDTLEGIELKHHTSHGGRLRCLG